MNDLAKLSNDVLPDLKIQAMQSLAFYGSLDELLVDPSSTELPKSIRWTIHVKNRFEQIAVTLMELLTESQVWVETFLSEIDSVAKQSATSEGSVAWLGSHLRAWLDDPDGGEYFYELELSVAPLVLWGEREEERNDDDDDDDVELLLWKGVVNQVVVVVIYRRGSFYMILRALHDVSSMPHDGLEFFGLLPALDGKGRGYLIRNFPAQIQQRSHQHQWLCGAKLLLWQTVASIAREDLAAEDAQATWRHSQCKRDEDKETSVWFEDKSNDDDAKQTTVRGECTNELVAVREAEHVRGDGGAKYDGGGEGCVAGSSSSRAREKVGTRHHLAPLRSTGARPPHTGTVAAPWDIRTGRPV